MGSRALTTLLDTDVLVECLRGSEPARAWLEASGDETFHVPGIVAMELLVGCRDQAEMRRCRKFLETFDVVWPEASEFAKACDLLVTHRLGSGMGIPDCLIASLALTRSMRLYSFNLKHLRVVEGLDVQEPYSRTKDTSS